VQIWPAGWYWLRAGSPYTNADIAKWAVAPLDGERISLVGESYNPQRSTWSDGAIKSSLRTLEEVFGVRVEAAAAPVNMEPAAMSRKKAVRRLRR
jgi:hypothetical protein